MSVEDGMLPKIAKASPKTQLDELGLDDGFTKLQTIMRKLEMEDSRPEKRELFQQSNVSSKKLSKEPFCKCEACTKRRSWRALIIASEDPKQPPRNVLDEFVQRAFQGDISFVQKIIGEFGSKAVQHVGGPVAVTNCEKCSAKSNLDTCHHCGKEPWMRSRADVRAARKDLAQIPRYLMMPALHAACFGGNLLIVDRLIKYGAEIDSVDELGCTPLHWITCNGHRRATFQSKVLDIWDLLCKHEVDVTVADSSGKVPIELTVPPNPPVFFL